MYDGYHFSEDSEGMYNPFSLLNTLQKKRFSEYWFETGTPSFLVKILKQTGYDITRLSENDVEIDSDMLSGVNDCPESMTTSTIRFRSYIRADISQSGSLTGCSAYTGSDSQTWR